MLNRRERRRRETFEEMIEVARRLLNQGSERSLRAVAAEMGMTSPALYRYVDSVEALNALMAGQILADVIDRMSLVREEFADDPAGQLAASTASFRSWALAWPLEFQLVFATPRAVRFTGATGPVSLDDAPSNYPNSILSDFFGDIFAELCLHGLIKVPPASQMDPTVVDVIGATLTSAQRTAMDRLGEAGPGTFWLLKLADVAGRAELQPAGP